MSRYADLWPTVPAWVQWIATNDGGHQYGYERLPSRGQSGWYNDDKRIVRIDNVPCPDWQDSLEQRPVVANGTPAYEPQEPLSSTGESQEFVITDYPGIHGSDPDSKIRRYNPTSDTQDDSDIQDLKAHAEELAKRNEKLRYQMAWDTFAAAALTALVSKKPMEQNRHTEGYGEPVGDDGLKLTWIVLARSSGAYADAMMEEREKRWSAKGTP